jgi:hypothetical protein
MSEIVNLRRVRKAKVRAAAAEQAAANRERFGQSRAVREAREQIRQIDARRLDGHFRESETAAAPVDDTTKTSSR